LFSSNYYTWSEEISEEYDEETYNEVLRLFEQIGERLGMDLKGTHVVGDSLRDLQAGVAVGCTLHLVHTGKGAAFQGQPLPTTFPSHTLTHADLAGFVDWLLDEKPDPRAAH
jgi:D-glycero-D-manno-heptose 1,7-bisphosphate phosphatase